VFSHIANGIRGDNIRARASAQGQQAHQESKIFEHVAHDAIILWYYFMSDLIVSELWQARNRAPPLVTAKVAVRAGVGASNDARLMNKAK
jgi:hypothetical protein